MKGTPSLHSNFFSSLKQVEKRLKLENPSSSNEPSSSSLMSPLPPSQLCEKQYTSTESLGSPIYIHSNLKSNQSSVAQDSELPCEFLSISHEFPSTSEHMHSETPQNKFADEMNSDVDDIELLMQLLYLTDSKEDGIELRTDDDDAESCHCGGGFYEKVVGVEGPKCEREVARMEGWIKYFGKNGEGDRIEPLRLAHLLLCKAAFMSGNSDLGCPEGLQFPSTISEFLMKDPPTE